MPRFWAIGGPKSSATRTPLKAAEIGGKRAARTCHEGSQHGSDEETARARTSLRPQWSDEQDNTRGRWWQLCLQEATIDGSLGGSSSRPTHTDTHTHTHGHLLQLPGYRSTLLRAAPSEEHFGSRKGVQSPAFWPAVRLAPKFLANYAQTLECYTVYVLCMVEQFLPGAVQKTVTKYYLILILLLILMAINNISYIFIFTRSGSENFNKILQY